MRAPRDILIYCFFLSVYVYYYFRLALGTKNGGAGGRITCTSLSSADLLSVRSQNRLTLIVPIERENGPTQVQICNKGKFYLQRSTFVVYCLYQQMHIHIFKHKIILQTYIKMYINVHKNKRESTNKSMQLTYIIIIYCIVCNNI